MSGQCCPADRHAAPVPGKPCPRQKGQASSCTDASTGHTWPRLWGAPREAEVTPPPSLSTPTGVPLPAHLCAAGKLTTRERGNAPRGLCPEPGPGLTETPGKQQGVLGYQASGKGRHHRRHDDLLFTNSIRPAPREPVCLGKDQQTPGKRLSGQATQ